jgi:hypothetical protein
MRKLIAVAAAAVALSLGACQTSTQVSSTVSSIEAQVQADANLACNFIPTAVTIGSVIASLAGAGAVVADAGTIAKSICDAIAAAPAPTQSAKLRSLRGNVALGINVNVGNLKLPGGKSVPIQGAFAQ